MGSHVILDVPDAGNRMKSVTVKVSLLIDSISLAAH